MGAAGRIGDDQRDQYAEHGGGNALFDRQKKQLPPGVYTQVQDSADPVVVQGINSGANWQWACCEENTSISPK